MAMPLETFISHVVDSQLLTAEELRLFIESVPLAWGDGITTVLAALTMIALYRSWRYAIALAWIFNVFGLLDLLHNGYGAARLQLAPQMGPIAYVVGFGVPLMLLFHLLVFRILLRR